MTIPAAALSMAQYAMMSNDQLVTDVTFSLIDNGSIFARDIPFVNNQSLVGKGVRFVNGLPTVDWVPLNTEGTAISVAPTPYEEQAFTFRNTIPVDKRYVQ